mmetsp:Transcript_8614/g.25882  ORF Transcript_8614/g.25882 Transcript_8614/m.25882 type:complete len:136 (-) Transcript_8614:334-741(-)
MSAKHKQLQRVRNGPPAASTAMRGAEAGAGVGSCLRGVWSAGARQISRSLRVFIESCDAMGAANLAEVEAVLKDFYSKMCDAIHNNVCGYVSIQGFEKAEQEFLRTAASSRNVETYEGDEIFKPSLPLRRTDSQS